MMREQMRLCFLILQAFAKVYSTICQCYKYLRTPVRMCLCRLLLEEVFVAIQTLKVASGVRQKSPLVTLEQVLIRFLLAAMLCMQLRIS
mmetsp:Transcript_12184/g.32883  ORF Transcript_12184/g.32883 Transcript_12184/m.32883 type:complete len:89 (+) Transcript_12184:93-359(+)